MSTATASADPAVAKYEGDERRLWRPLPTYLSYLATGGLYGIYWFFVTRREMARELGREPSGAVAILEGIGQLIPVVSAFVWYRVFTDLNELREKVRAPTVHVWGWIAALALWAPLIYVVPEVLGPITDLFNTDVRAIIRAVGYAMFPAQLLVFAWVMGYYNEYWLEKTGERAGYRKIGPLEIIGLLLAAAMIIGIIAAFVSEI